MTLTKYRVHTLWFNHTDLETHGQPLQLCVRWRKIKKQPRMAYGRFQVTGTLEALLYKYLERLYDKETQFYYPPTTPPGIYIDRLEECPEELVGATDEEHGAIVDYLRRRYPNGV